MALRGVGEAYENFLLALDMIITEYFKYVRKSSLIKQKAKIGRQFTTTDHKKVSCPNALKGGYSHAL